MMYEGMESELHEKPVFIKPDISIEDLSRALYETSQRLASTNSELEKLQKDQLDFFANISHDLRSPVTAVKNAVAFLLAQDNLNTSDAQDMLHMIERRTIYLEQLVNDIFLLSSLDYSQRTPQFEKVNIGMFLEDFFFSCQADQRYEQRKLILKVPVTFPYECNIDTSLMQRVLDNLFNNALKYSHCNDSIQLRAEIDLAKHAVIIHVDDSGIGIAPEHIDKIFTRTYTVDHSRSQNYHASCGLGLSIVQSILKLHHASIHCTSTLGVGSSFEIVLPLAYEN